MTCTAIILAGGSSTRMGGINKQFIEIDGIPVIIKSALAFEECDDVTDIVIAARESDIAEIKKLSERYNISKLRQIVKGGNSRTESAKNAFSAAEKTDIILVHDGARPFVSEEVIVRVIDTAVKYGASVPVIPVKDTIKESDGGFVTSTPDRSRLFAAQTPQGFTHSIYSEIVGYEGEATDDAGIAEALGYKVRITEGDERNIKLTTPEDIKGTERKSDMRIGYGYDVHRLTENRKLILGGVEIPSELGLLGHSDADVLVHAVMDALLGALALGDIGKHFPDTDPKYKGISSMELLAHVVSLITEKGYKVSNLDATINAEKPKLAKFIPDMRENIAKACGVSVDDISVKATTEEGLGLKGEGIGTSCVCLLARI